MAKQIIRLTEGDLHRIVKESIKRILKEEDWRDELNAVYDAGKEEGSAGFDIDKVSSILGNVRKQYGKDAEGYKQALDDFYSEREKIGDAEKAKKDPAFELWSDEFESNFNKAGYPLAKDFKSFPYNKSKYNQRVRNGELPRSFRRFGVKSNDSEEPSVQVNNSPYAGKSPEEIEQIMKNSGFAK
jgi:hypothetical protein